MPTPVRRLALTDRPVANSFTQPCRKDTVIRPLLPLKMIGKSSSVGCALSNVPALVTSWALTHAGGKPSSHSRSIDSAAPA
jgi:hypothetical protein